MENDLKILDGYEEYSKISTEMQMLSKYIEVENDTGKSKPIKARPSYLKVKMGGKMNEQ